MSNPLLVLYSLAAEKQSCSISKAEQQIDYSNIQRHRDTPSVNVIFIDINTVCNAQIHKHTHKH